MSADNRSPNPSMVDPKADAPVSTEEQTEPNKKEIHDGRE